MDVHTGHCIQAARVRECVNRLSKAEDSKYTELALLELLDVNYKVSFLPAGIAQELLKVCEASVARSMSQTVRDSFKELLWTIQTSPNQVVLSDDLLLRLVRLCLRDFENNEAVNSVEKNVERNSGTSSGDSPSRKSASAVQQFSSNATNSQPEHRTSRLLLNFHALGALVYQNSGRLNSVWSELCAVLRSSLEDPDPVVRHSSLKVFEALTIRREESPVTPTGGENVQNTGRTSTTLTVSPSSSVGSGGYLSQEQVDIILSMIIDSVAKTFSSSDELMHCKILQASVKTLFNLASGGASIPSPKLGYLLGWMRHLTFLGFPGYAQRPIKEFDLFPSPVCYQLPHVEFKLDESSPSKDKSVVKHLRGKKTRRKKASHKSSCTTGSVSVLHNVKTEESPSEDSDTCGSVSPSQRRLNVPWSKPFESSDSEQSENESGLTIALSPQNFKNHIKAVKAKIRQLAYDTIRVLLLNVDKKEKFGYLLNFLPQQSGSLMRSTEHSLTLSMLKDPSAQVRSAAINLLKEFIVHSRQYLILAKESAHATSFTSLSEAMAIIITEIHRALHLAVLSEQIPIFLVPLISCLCLLIWATPYDRLKAILVVDICNDLKFLLQNKYEQVRVGVLTCYGGLVCHSPPHPEVIKGLGLEDDHWFETMCIEKLTTSSGEVNQVKLEILQTLSRLVSNHFGYSVNVFGLYIKAICATLNDACGSVRIHGMKLTAALAKQIADQAALEKSAISVNSATTAQAMGTDLWKNCLFCGEGRFQACLQGVASDDLCGSASSNVEKQPHETISITDHEHRELQVLQREAFVTLSHIGERAWSGLPARSQRFSICVLLSYASPSDSSIPEDIAIAALRTLAVLCTYPCMAHEVTFLQDFGDLCIGLLSSSGQQNERDHQLQRLQGQKAAVSFDLKVKASWALSNVCEALWTLRKLDVQRLEEEISTDFYQRLLETSISAHADKDRVRVNAVRSIGILLGGIATDYYLSALNSNILSTAIKLVMASASCSSERFFKAKWNACYSIGWMIQNEATRCQFDVPTAVHHLCRNLSSCLNLKVQIACISSLGFIMDIDPYTELDAVSDDVRLEIFSALVDKAVQLPSVQVDYKELKHLQALKESLCLALFRHIRLYRNFSASSQTNNRKQLFCQQLFLSIKANQAIFEQLIKSALTSTEVCEKLLELVESDSEEELNDLLTNLKQHLRHAMDRKVFSV